MKKFIFYLLITLSSQTRADIDEKIGFKDLTQEKADTIHEELSANFTHTSVSPANALGEYWGIEFGGVFTSTSSPELDFQRENHSNLAYAQGLSYPESIFRIGALARLSLGRLIFEAAYMPKFDSRDYEYETQSAAVAINFLKDQKWFVKYFSLDASLKAHYAKTNIYIDQNSSRESSVATDPGRVSYESEIKGALLTISSNDHIFQPFFGAGYLKSNGKLNFIPTNSGGSIFSSSGSLAGLSSTQMSQSSTHFLLGFQLHFWIVNISFERAWLFGTDTGSFKLSFEI